LAPLIDEIAGNMDGKLKVCKVDVDKNMQTAARFGVRGIPFIVLLKDGKEVDSVTGNDPSRVSALAEQANS
jgi:thioredoxin 1